MSEQKPHLARELGFREGFAIHVGSIIGSGIFIVPATMAGHLPAFGPLLLVWILSGGLTLFGALSLAELSAILPQAGGPYVYLRHSFGRLLAFLFSWNDFFINKAGSAAALAVGFATYLGHFVPATSPENAFYVASYSLLGQPMEFSFGWTQITAIAVIVLVTFFNVRGVKFGGWVMNIFTAAKLMALVGLIAAVVVSGRGSWSNIQPWWPEQWEAGMFSAFGVAMISALWAYDGWISVTLNTGEFRNPQREVPLSLILGTVTVIAVYLAANLAYASVIPLSDMPASSRIAADVAKVVLGPIGASLIVIGIMSSMFGTTNAQLLTGPRSLYAAGTDGTFSRKFGEIHPRFRTPYVAILTLGIWGAILTLSGTYDQIAAYVVFGSWAFYALTALCVIILRRKMPDAKRPYKAWAYPYGTLLFVGIAGWFIFNTLVEDTRNAIVGIGLLALGIPFYYYWRNKNRSVASEE
ncbi:MAG TPA: amino acid permease [Bacteroidota bacterium]|nr:amino acid permease [Bacteroidota bacterium]